MEPTQPPSTMGTILAIVFLILVLVALFFTIRWTIRAIRWTVREIRSRFGKPKETQLSPAPWIKPAPKNDASHAPVVIPAVSDFGRYGKHLLKQAKKSGHRVSQVRNTQKTITAKEPEPSKGEYDIEYMDADGVITERSITFMNDEGWRKGRFWCHLRSDQRTFLYDNMLRIRNNAIGALLSPDELREELGIKRKPAVAVNSSRASDLAAEASVKSTRPAYFDDGLSTDPAPTEEAWETYGDAISLLVYAGRIDGTMAKSEREIIHDFIISRKQPKHIAEDLCKRIRYVRLPSIVDIDKLLRKINKEAGTEMKKELIDLCRSVIEADGKIHPDEEMLMGRITRLLNTE